MRRKHCCNFSNLISTYSYLGFHTIDHNLIPDRTNAQNKNFKQWKSFNSKQFLLIKSKYLKVCFFTNGIYMSIESNEIRNDNKIYKSLMFYTDSYIFLVILITKFNYQWIKITKICLNLSIQLYLSIYINREGYPNSIGLGTYLLDRCI